MRAIYIPWGQHYRVRRVPASAGHLLWWGILLEGCCLYLTCLKSPLPGQQWELSAKFFLPLPKTLHIGTVLSGVSPPAFLLWFLLKRSWVTRLTGHVSSNSHFLKSLLEVQRQQDPARTATFYSPSAVGDGKMLPISSAQTQAAWNLA